MRVRRSGASPNHHDFGVPSPQPLSQRERGLKPTAAKVKPCESPGRAGRFPVRNDEQPGALLRRAPESRSRSRGAHRSAFRHQGLSYIHGDGGVLYHCAKGLPLTQRPIINQAYLFEANRHRCRRDTKVSSKRLKRSSHERCGGRDKVRKVALRPEFAPRLI